MIENTGIDPSAIAPVMFLLILGAILFGGMYFMHWRDKVDESKKRDSIQQCTIKPSQSLFKKYF